MKKINFKDIFKNKGNKTNVLSTILFSIAILAVVLLVYYFTRSLLYSFISLGVVLLIYYFFTKLDKMEKNKNKKEQDYSYIFYSSFLKLLFEDISISKAVKTSLENLPSSVKDKYENILFEDNYCVPQSLSTNNKDYELSVLLYEGLKSNKKSIEYIGKVKSSFNRVYCENNTIYTDDCMSLFITTYSLYLIFVLYQIIVNIG